MKQIQCVAVCIAMLLLGSGVYAQNITDSTIKRNAKTIDDATASLSKLEPKQFEYEVDKYGHLGLQKGIQYGFFAENVEQAFPDLVKQKNVSYAFSKNAYKDARLKIVDEKGLIPVMVAAIKELHIQVETLKAEISVLKQK